MYIFEALALRPHCNWQDDEPRKKIMWVCTRCTRNGSWNFRG